jgi:hypothetical protein
VWRCESGWKNWAGGREHLLPKVIGVFDSEPGEVITLPVSLKAQQGKSTA